MQYHFWSKYLTPASRSPKKNNKKQNQFSIRPEKTERTLAAIEGFVAIQVIVLGVIQLLACKFPEIISEKSRCWIRTPCEGIPSAFVTKTALANTFPNNLFTFASDWITRLILQKQERDKNLKKVA